MVATFIRVSPIATASNSNKDVITNVTSPIAEKRRNSVYGDGWVNADIVRDGGGGDILE
jgi:hypothetical protein